MTIDEISKILIETPQNFPEALIQYLEKGGDVNARDAKGWPLIVRAVKNLNREAIELLLIHSADINNTIESNGYTALHYLVAKSDILSVNNKNVSLINFMDFLIKHNADVNIKCKKGDTPLHFAVRLKEEPFVEKLLEGHPDSNITNRHGNTTIIEAADDGYDSIVKLLVNSGADLEALLTYPNRSPNVTMYNYMRPSVEKNLEKYRPRLFEILKEYNYIIPTPSSPYDAVTAQEVAKHNAEVEAHLAATEEALNKTGLYKAIKNIIYGYLYPGSPPFSKSSASKSTDLTLTTVNSEENPSDQKPKANKPKSSAPPSTESSEQLSLLAKLQQRLRTIWDKLSILVSNAWNAIKNKLGLTPKENHITSNTQSGPMTSPDQTARSLELQKGKIGSQTPESKKQAAASHKPRQTSKKSKRS